MVSFCDSGEVLPHFLWGCFPLIQDSLDLIKNQGLCSYRLQGLHPKWTCLGFLCGLTVSFAFVFALHYCFFFIRAPIKTRSLIVKNLGEILSIFCMI